MLKRLNWNMFPVTVYTWASWLMSEWDSFCLFHFKNLPNNDLKEIEVLPLQDRDYQKMLYEHRMILFKEKTETAYSRYRETLQVLDASLLDQSILQLSPRQASCGLLYLMLNNFFFLSDYALIFYSEGSSNTSDSSLTLAFGNEYFMNPSFVEIYRHEQAACKVKELVCNFLSLAAEVSDPVFLEVAMNYFKGYYDRLQRDYTPPPVTRNMSRETLKQEVYEDFLSYQTYNPYSRESVFSR